MSTITVDNTVFDEHEATVTAYEAATDSRWALVIRIAPETPAFVVMAGGRQGTFVVELGAAYEGGVRPEASGAGKMEMKDGRQRFTAPVS